MVIKPKRNNAQHQPLTTVLRNIIREYPAGGGVLRELCQKYRLPFPPEQISRLLMIDVPRISADDSGATMIEFVLDTSTYPTEPLLHAGLAEYQGPALFAYNNRTFSERDFRSLSKIGDSEKMNDVSSTGKFGRGFNSVYNFTDNPSILSGSSLLILDPHEAWSRDVGEPGGPLYDFVEDCQEQEMVNQLAAFGHLLPDHRSSFDGTLIRLPLRTMEQAKRSRILLDKDRRPTEIDDIKSIFKSFAVEMAESLLFLRHISSIILRIDDEIFAKAVARKFNSEGEITDAFSIDTPYQSVLVRGDEPRAEINFVTEIAFQLQGKEQISKFAVTHLMRHETGESELGKWARSYKLFPWTAIATPILEVAGSKFSGRLFSTLPLPVRVDHHAHIHAMFSITPDRASIHKDEDSTASENSETKMGAQWNRWIFQELVVHAWVGNLQYVHDLTLRKRCAFSGWSLWPVGSQDHGDHSTHISAILGLVFEKIVIDGRKLLPTISHSTACASEVLFAEELEEQLKNALRNAHVVVIHPPTDKRTEISRKLAPTMDRVSPRTVRAALTALRGTLHTLNATSRSILLDYILTDRDYEDIGKCEAPLIPLVDGSYGSFQKSSMKYRFSRESELSLFTECKAFSIVNSKLSEGTYNHFMKYMGSFQRFTTISPWNILGAHWYLVTYVFSAERSNKQQSNDIITRPELMEWIERFWRWAISKDQENLLSVMGDLWLIPLSGGRLRKLSEIQPALDISGSSQVSQLFKEIVSAGTDYPIYSESLSQKISDFFRRSKRIYCCENFEELVTWLGMYPSFLETASKQQRSQLVLQLGVMSPVMKYQNITPGEKECLQGIVQILRKLPLYHEAFVRRPERPWIDLDDIDSKYVAVSCTDGLPALQVSNTIFVDRDEPGVKNILIAFDLAATPSRRMLLEKYVLADMRQASFERKSALSKYVLRPQCFGDLAIKAREDLAGTKFVPVCGKEIFATPKETVDTDMPVSKLYFEDEGVFPDATYLAKHRQSLEQLGMITRITDKVLLERIEMYSEGRREIDEISGKVQHLLNLAASPPKLEAKHCQMRWIPASKEGIKKLYNAMECRDYNQKELIEYSMPLTELEFSRTWHKRLGWDVRPDCRYILKQLDEAVARQDTSAILSLLKSKWLSGIQELDTRAWIPGASGGYYRRSDVFFKSASFHPYIDNVNLQVGEYLNLNADPIFQTQQVPSFEKLREVQVTIVAKGRMAGEDLKVFVALLEQVAPYFNDSDDASWMAPDTNGTPRALSELTAGAQPGDAGAMNLHLLHPSIPPTIVEALRIPTIQQRFLHERVGPEFVQDYEQSEDLTVVISDTLKRYSSRRTFNEYLANAEDSGGASDICWILDQTEYHERTKLITKELEECHGPSLLCFNNGVFREKDFQAIVKIGVGSRGDEPSKIGRFGRGSLTMYHYTQTPMILSGDYFVIFDPEQLRLPENPATRKRLRGMRIAIKQVRQLWPDQLRPFVGQFGFAAESDSFDGTLFRFPIMKSREKSKIYSSRDPTTIRTVEMALTEYYKDAVTALVFLKNIKSIRFQIQDGKASNKLQWEVITERPPGHMIGISTFKIKHKILQQADFKTTETEWMVARSMLEPHEIPADVRVTCERHKLEARCGIAARIVPSQLSDPGRLFLGAPTDHKLGLPVHVSADLAIQSDRHAWLESDGHDWNRWLMESQVAPLYATLLAEIAKLPKCPVYEFWPEYPQESAKSNGPAIELSNVLKASFWTTILNPDCEYKIFPVHKSDVAGAWELTTANHACFNLLSNSEMPKILAGLLHRMPLRGWKLVRPTGKALSGLKRVHKTSESTTLRTLSPIFVAELFKNEENCEMLWEEWGRSHNSDIAVISNLFKFILTDEIPPEILLGCTILPLADKSRGLFRSKGDADFMIPVSNDTLSEALEGLVPQLIVHPQLGESIFHKLTSGGLNVSHFFLKDLPRVLEVMGDQSAKRRRELFVEIWRVYNNLAQHDPSKAVEAYGALVRLPIVVATRPGDASEYAFIRLDEFQQNRHVAILEDPLGRKNWPMLSLDLPKVNEILQSFADAGLYQVNARTFPESGLGYESLETCAGLYRLLLCIETLAARRSSTIEAFIMSRSLGNPNYLRKLSQILRFADWNDFESKFEARRILRQIPLLPSTDSEEQYISALRARVAPSASLDLKHVPLAQNFVTNSWAQSHPRRWEFLLVPRLEHHEFLADIVLVRGGNRLPGGVEGLKNYLKIVEWINKDFPEAMQTEPVALDRNLTFRLANTLFDHENYIFKAAFYDENEILLPNKFLHPELRGFRWHTMKTINSAIYRQCARAIEEQSRNPSTDGVFLVRAIKVFEFLRFETPEVQAVCGNGHHWTKIKHIQFVPALFPEQDGTMLNKEMRRNVPDSRVISLSDGIDPRDVKICWSQKCFFLDAPSNYVLQSLPNQGRPKPQDVVSHLVFLAQERSEISEIDIKSFLSSAKACYKYLQDSDEGFTIPEDKEVWYNSDQETALLKKDFQNSWVSSRDLCLNLEYDSAPLQYVRESLQNFHSLLRTSGVRSIQRIGPPPASLQSATTYSDTLVSEFQSFHKSGRFVDLHILVDDHKFGVHKMVLCAASEYFQRMFESPMAMVEQTENMIDWRGNGISVETVERMLDYIYTGVLAEFPPDDPSYTVEILLELMNTADAYFLPGLKRAVEVMLWDEQYLRPETARAILECARDCRADELRQLAEQYCKDNADIIARV